jgi:hypothetical protein
MIRRRALVLSLGIMFCSQAGAQNISQDEVYATKPVRDEIAKALIDQFLGSAKEAGFTSAESSVVTQGIRNSTLAFGQGGAMGVVRSSEGVVPIRNRTQLVAFQRILGGPAYIAVIEKYATVRLSVIPVPPRDYAVTINGEDCPATERSIYRVMPGSVTVEVIRKNKPACQWSGTIDRGKERVIDCSL